MSKWHTTATGWKYIAWKGTNTKSWVKKRTVVKQRNTKKPTGIKIVRSGNKLTLEWKHGEDDYTDQDLLVGVYGYGQGSDVEKYEYDLGKQTTSKVISNNLKIYKPKTGSISSQGTRWDNIKTVNFATDWGPDKNCLSSIGIQICAKRKNTETGYKTVKTKHENGVTKRWEEKTKYYYDVSDWAKYTYNVYTPYAPDSLKFTISSNVNAGTFTWSNDSRNTTSSNHIFVKYRYRTARLENWSESHDFKKYAGVKEFETWSDKEQWIPVPGKKNTSVWGYKHTVHGKWSGWTTTNSTSWYHEEDFPKDPSDISKPSYTRVFELQAGGPAGWGDSVYAYYVYANPLTPEICKPTAVVKDAKGNFFYNNFRVKVYVKQPSDLAHPVETIKIQYYIGAPVQWTPGNKHCKMRPQVGSSFTDGPSLAHVKKNNVLDVDFNIDSNLNKNECLWVRATAVHGPFEAESSSWMIQSGGLTKPTNLVAVAYSTSAITVSADNGASSVPHTFLAIYLQRYKNGKLMDKDPMFIGYMKGASPSKTVNCPSLEGYTYRVGVKAFAGDDPTELRRTGYNLYKLGDYAMTSGDIVWDERDTVALPPTNLSAEAISSTDVRLSWVTSWNQADAVTLSWSKKETAWESTSQPSTYDIDDRKNSWVVSDLEENETYYFRVKLKDTDEDTESPWSEMINCDLKAANIAATTPPILGSDKTHYGMNETMRLTVATGATGALTYSIAQWDATNSTVVKRPGVVKRSSSSPDEPVVTEQILIESNSAQLSLTAETINTIYGSGLSSWAWAEGGEYQLVARVASEGSEPTGWSEPITVNIIPAPPVPIITFNSPNMASITIEEDTDPDTGDPITRSVDSLIAYPMSITISNTNDNTVAVFVERVNGYIITRPDEKKEEVYAGDIVASREISGNDTIIFDVEDFNSIMDDGMIFRVRAILTDDYGNNSKAYKSFETHFTHQPMVPDVTVLREQTGYAMRISVAPPLNLAEGDTFDVYRLSLDRPMLILKGGQYGTVYVDPYPAFGDNCGYRIVATSAAYDYTSTDGSLAWTDAQPDYDDIIRKPGLRIDFDNDYIDLPYNVTLSNTWAKDFKRTTYLGGSVQGDWNPAVTRDLNAETVGITAIEGGDSDSKMRMLADYTGICHVRTSDGSSFAADVQVQENRNYETHWLIEWSLTIQKIDGEALDAITLEQWNRQQVEDPIEPVEESE